MGELIMASLFFIMSIVFIITAGKFPVMKDMPIHSDTFPKAIAILMLIYSGILIIRTIKKLKEKQELPQIGKRTLIAMAGAVVYYFVFDYLGYIISSILLLILYAALLQKKKLRTLDTFILPTVFVIGLYFAFKLLKVYLPLGQLLTGILG